MPRGLLRVAAPGTFGVLRLAPLIGDYVRLYPEVSVDIVLSDRFVNLIEEGFDVALRIGALPDSSLVARQVSSARLVACAAPAYLQRAGTPKAPADLARYPCLIYAETAAPRLWQFTDAGGRTETVRVSGPVTANGTEFLLRLVLDGHGVMLAPSFLVDAEIAAGRLTPVLTEWRLRDLPVHLLYPHRPLLAAKVRSFIDFLVARLG